MKKNYKESSKRGAFLWYWQRISGIVLFAILFFHFISYHFISQGSYKWERVVPKMQSPWFNLLQFLFLITGLYHGLNGLWMISEDYFHSRSKRMIIISVLFLLGISLLFVGTLTIFKISTISVESIAGGAK